MTAALALAYLLHEVQRGQDFARAHHDPDALTLATLEVPALCRVLGVSPLDDFAALGFKAEFRAALKALVERDGYQVSAACVECGAASQLRLDVFQGEQARHWCEGCGRESRFALAKSVVSCP